MPEVTMPQLGESVTEGLLGRWLKGVGHTVAKYEPLVEIVTDKVTAEMPSPHAGVVVSIAVPEGESVPVGTVLCVIEPPGTSETPTETRARYSPAVRQLAREHHIDLQTVKGTGAGGRITRRDVEAIVAQKSTAATPPANPSPEPAPPLQEMPSLGTEHIALSPMRIAVAQHMVRSKATSPHAWTMVEVDVTGLVALRARLGAEFSRREDIKLTFLPFVLSHTALALRAFPRMNSSWADDGIRVHRDINISVAVSLADGIITPVLRHADTLSTLGLARAIQDVATRARAGRLSVEELSGGTFTVNNPGAFGSVASFPILNQPQAAMLTTEAVVRRPWVVGDGIAIRHIMNMCLSFDHRVLDGLTVGSFLADVKARLEAITGDEEVR